MMHLNVRTLKVYPLLFRDMSLFLVQTKLCSGSETSRIGFQDLILACLLFLIVLPWVVWQGEATQGYWLSGGETVTEEPCQQRLSWNDGRRRVDR